MQASQTSGLALYQQVVNQTPGIASSIWAQSTSAQHPVIVEVTPILIEEKSEESSQEKTASRVAFGASA
jgi:hypothetical protein